MAYLEDLSRAFLVTPHAIMEESSREGKGLFYSNCFAFHSSTRFLHKFFFFFVVVVLSLLNSNEGHKPKEDHPRTRPAQNKTEQRWGGEVVAWWWEVV